ncbi:MAG: hypothetical protein M1829_002210 [Trizodia sp. TS-e1964]|nr:MAG: hypothetical protein M1829_002210 [Trizodia sp. TS-e1964]
MTDYERIVLDHYKINSSFPVEWPTEKDLSDASEDEYAPIPPPKNSKGKLEIPFRPAKRYSALGRSPSDSRSILSSPGRGNDTTAEASVQKDEPDPLGTTDSIVRVLQRRGLPVEEDARLRSQFLLSSSSFSPELFLSQVHSNASTQSLMQGMDFLTRSIDQQSVSLKVLVESNFERFVRAKTTIDNVYSQMRNQGIDPHQETRKALSRHTSRTSLGSGIHSRNPGAIPSNNLGINKPLPSDKMKNALTKESEYGLAGIKAPLLESSRKAEDIWGPAFGSREREDSLKAVLSTVEAFHGIFEVGAIITDCIKRKDYDGLIEEYGKARGYCATAKTIGQDSLRAESPISDSDLQLIVVTARMWVDVEAQIEEFKKDIWRRLAGMKSHSNSSSLSGTNSEEHMELISILLELGVQDNPIWVWLLSRYDYLRNKISTTSERSRADIEMLRRRLAKSNKPNANLVASYLRSSARHGLGNRAGTLDTVDVIELWERIHTNMTKLLSSQGGILGEVIEFWDTAMSFIEGKTQQPLPVGYDGQSKVHHRLSLDGTKQLQNGALELINQIRESVFSFFAEPPIEDLSVLLTPKSPNPDSPKSASQRQTPSIDQLLTPDSNGIPPFPEKLGEAWEKLAFWPPRSNSLSGVFYLNRILALAGTAANEMAAMNFIEQGSSTTDRLRLFIAGTRERCVQALCAAWNKDAEDCKALEDWTRSSEKRDITKMPMHFMAFESAVITGMQKILFISEVVPKPGIPDVVTPPPAKLLQMVRGQFVTSLYKALSGMVENADNLASRRGGIPEDSDTLASPLAIISPMNVSSTSIDPSDRNVRMLLTLSNLQVLRTEVVPQLIAQFENSFSVKLTDESKAIRDVLGQIDARLFQTYVAPSISTISHIVRAGILSPAWEPSTPRPSEVRPYIYSLLLTLVVIHTQVSTTAASLTPQILSYLLEKTSQTLLNTFKERGNFSLAALMQATLDVEFVAQTLLQYTTEKASKLQNEIYVEIDRGTGDDARVRLQKELPEMRVILKGLREKSKSML